MGNLIKVLGKDLENCPHFFLDFESKCSLGRCLFGVSVSESGGPLLHPKLRRFSRRYRKPAVVEQGSFVGASCDRSSTVLL
jgi:hypothetical protein